MAARNESITTLVSFPQSRKQMERGDRRDDRQSQRVDQGETAADDFFKRLAGPAGGFARRLFGRAVNVLDIVRRETRQPILRPGK